LSARREQRQGQQPPELTGRERLPRC
jgi:hypothetical protein